MQHELCIIDTFTAVGLFDGVLCLFPSSLNRFADLRECVVPHTFTAASLLSLPAVFEICRALKYDSHAYQISTMQSAFTH